MVLPLIAQFNLKSDVTFCSVAANEVCPRPYWCFLLSGFYIVSMTRTSYFKYYSGAQFPMAFIFRTVFRNPYKTWGLVPRILIFVSSNFIERGLEKLRKIFDVLEKFILKELFYLLQVFLSSTLLKYTVLMYPTFLLHK